MNMCFYNTSMGEILMFVRHIDGRMTGIEVSSDAMVIDLYERLRGVIYDSSRLSFGGTTLNDLDKLLADIGVTQEVVVNEVNHPHLRLINTTSNIEVIARDSDECIYICDSDKNGKLEISIQASDFIEIVYSSSDCIVFLDKKCDFQSIEVILICDDSHTRQAYNPKNLISNAEFDIAFGFYMNSCYQRIWRLRELV